MSLHQDHGNHVFSCDGTGCRSKLETNTSNWDAALNLVRRAKWKAIKLDSWPGASARWANLCAQCVKANVQISHHESNPRQGGVIVTVDRTRPKQIGPRFSASDYARLKRMALQTGLTPTELVKSLVITVLDDDDKAHGKGTQPQTVSPLKGVRE